MSPGTQPWTMDQHQQRDHPYLWIEARAIGTGLLGGLLAGLAMGVVLQLGTDILQALGAYLGETSALRGWIVHLGISLVYGAVFAAILAYPPIESQMEDFGTTEHVLVGVTYATMIAALTLAVLPFVFELPWTTLADQSPSQEVPSTRVGGLLPAMVFAVAHIVYGAILGAVFASFAESTD